MNKKIFIMAYARKNLGDDIFIKMILEKYPNFQFYMKIPDENFLDWLSMKYKNLNVLKGEDTDEELYKSNVEDFDTYIYVGGSIFMEGGKVYNLSPKFYDFVKRCKEKNIPFCYISSNYGPYQTKEYFELSRKDFKICTDICFRDKYSYNLFKDIENVRYAPDYAFSYNLAHKEKIKKSVGISVIDLNIRDYLKDKNSIYYKWLLNNINVYIKEGYSVFLYSFCEHERDEKTVDYLMKKLGENENIHDVRYRGNIDEFLELYAKMEYMICSRFHAMVLSAVANQKMYVIYYSNKISNVIDDLNLDIPLLNLKDIKEEDIIDLKVFKSVKMEQLEKIKTEAKKQEKVLMESLEARKELKRERGKIYKAIKNILIKNLN